MNRYPALRMVSLVYRVFGVLVGLVVVVGNVLIAGDFLIALIGGVVGVIIGVSLYAVGELILLLIHTGTNTRKTSLALVWMYEQQKERQELAKMDKEQNAKPRRAKSLRKGA